jgi:hypothetical protein
LVGPGRVATPWPHRSRGAAAYGIGGTTRPGR